MARVFALVVRCRIMMLFVYSRVGKNRDTIRGPRQEPGRAVPPPTKRSSLARKFSRYGAAIAYTDLLGLVKDSLYFIVNGNIVWLHKVDEFGYFLFAKL